MTRFKVSSMTCGGCASSISKAVRSVDPAAVVDTDVPNRVVSIQSDANPAALADVIREAGYEPEAL